MSYSEVLLVAGVNLITGAGLLALSILMLRRPRRLWIGFRPARDAGEMERLRRTNIGTGGMIAGLGVGEVLSGPVAYVAGISPLPLAGVGLGILMLAVVTLVASAFASR